MNAPFELVDSHLHYWQPSTPSRPWAAGAPEPDTEPWLVERLLAETESAGVTRVVQVVPSLLGYDNRYAFEGAERYPEKIAGVFARIDPLSADMLTRLATLRAQPKFMGIRLTLFSPVERSWLEDPAPLRPLFDEAAKRAFPIAVFARGLPREMMRLAQHYPRTRILVDHMSLDWRHTHPFDVWPHVLAMAKVPNIVMKASYLPEASHEEVYPYPRAKLHFRELYDAFGEDRLIWGSNFPPSKVACSYRQSVDFMLDACSYLPQSVQAKIFAGNLLSVTSRCREH